MNNPFTKLLFQRLPYVLILALFFCIVPWNQLQLFSAEFWIVVVVTSLFLFQIIKNNAKVWGLIVALFSFYSVWMVLAFLSDLNKSGTSKDEFVLYGNLFLIALFLVDIWLIVVKPEKVEVLG